LLNDGEKGVDCEYDEWKWSVHCCSSFLRRYRKSN